MRDSAGNRVLPHLLPIPVREQAHLPQILSRRQTVNFHLLQIFTRGGLFSPQTREPDVKRFKRAHERFDFSQLATPSGLAEIQHTESPFLLSNRLRGKHVDQIERPLLGYSIAILVRLRKVISSIEKEHGNLWDALPQKM